MIFRSISEISLLRISSNASFANILKLNTVSSKACRSIFTITGPKQMDISSIGRLCSSTTSDNEGDSFDLQNVVRDAGALTVPKT